MNLGSEVLPNQATPTESLNNIVGSFYKCCATTWNDEEMTMGRMK